MIDVSEEIVPIKADLDVVVARQRARGLLSGWRFSGSELTLIATAISEVARNIVSYAGKGEIVLRVVRRGQQRGLLVIARRPRARDCRYRTRYGGRLTPTSRGLGLGLPGSKRLMDEFELVSEVGKGTEVTMIKWER